MKARPKICTLEQALALKAAGLPQRAGYGSYYYWWRGKYTSTPVDGAPYGAADEDWYGTKLLAAPTREEVATAIVALNAAMWEVFT